MLELDYAKLQNHPYYHLYDLEVLSVNEANIIQALNGAVGLVGAVLVTASQTPKVILRKHLKHMQKQGVVIDVA
ncbi:alanine dehydrogenase, partial [Helicobacter pylori NCTC 11637 = CCUG 17874 = ATCC 43504 = JCM 12093]